MNLKKISLIVTVTLATMFVTVGCKTPITINGTPQTPAQIAAIVCPIVNSDLAALQQLTDISASDKAAIQTKLQPIVTAACAATGTVNISNLQSLATTGYPVAQSLIQNSSLNANDKNNALIALNLLNGTLQAVLAADPAANIVIVPPQAATSASLAVPLVPTTPGVTTTPAPATK